MPRPRKHGAQTRTAIIEAAEKALSEGGPEALTIRRVADDVGTTTWAVYSIFGSREGLLGACATEAMIVLERGLQKWPQTDDPADDLIGLGSRMYRAFVKKHPWLFRLAFQRIVPELDLGDAYFAARARCWEILEGRVQRVEEHSGLGGRTVRDATVEFNAMCEGLANAELRGGTLAPGNQQRIWDDAFAVVVHGIVAAPPRSKLSAETRTRKRRA